MGWQLSRQAGSGATDVRVETWGSRVHLIAKCFLFIRGSGGRYRWRQQDDQEQNRSNGSTGDQGIGIQTINRYAL